MDKRFKHVVNDPKFRYIPKSTNKVKIDKRFKSIFEDKNFITKYTVDKRGRPINNTSKEDLKCYYELSSGESDSAEDNEPCGKYVRTPNKTLSSEHSNLKQCSEIVKHGNRKSKQTSKKNQSLVLDSADSHQKSNTETADKQKQKVDKVNVKDISKSTSSEDHADDLSDEEKSDEPISEIVKKKLENVNIDYARGESRLFSESSSDDDISEDDEESEEEVVEHNWGELDADAEHTEEATARLAACNMDWDRVRAVDLMVLLNSFLPTGRFIKSVVIYPSEFGKQRMQEEEMKGPIELVESRESLENKDETEEGSKYHMEKLRQYQLNRLKYYYAVVTFDSAEEANKIYTECDGMEYESSSTKLDLRFVPDDMTFEDEPKEVCDKLPDSGKYKPRFFTTTALQQAKVDLTWDETDPDRLEIAQKLNSGKLENVEDTDLKHYLASSSEDEIESETESQKDNENSHIECPDPINKYRALLQEIEENEQKKKEKDIQMEVYWDVGLEKKSEQLVQKRLEEKVEKTPFEQYLEKRKQRRKEKKKKSEQDTSDESDSDIPDGIDMNNPYFAEEFNTPEFKNTSKQNRKKKSDSEMHKNEDNNTELELLLMEEDDDKKHFSLKKIQEQENTKKNKKKLKKNKGHNITEDDFAVNVNDERFSALFTSNHFSIDPTNANFKKTKGMEKLITEKLKRGGGQTEGNIEKKLKVSKNTDPEISTLIKTTKLKLRNCSKTQ